MVGEDKVGPVDDMGLCRRRPPVTQQGHRTDARPGERARGVAPGAQDAGSSDEDLLNVALRNLLDALQPAVEEHRRKGVFGKRFGAQSAASDGLDRRPRQHRLPRVRRRARRGRVPAAVTTALIAFASCTGLVPAPGVLLVVAILNVRGRAAAAPHIPIVAASTRDYNTHLSRSPTALRATEERPPVVAQLVALRWLRRVRLRHAVDDVAVIRRRSRPIARL